MLKHNQLNEVVQNKMCRTPTVSHALAFPSFKLLYSIRIQLTPEVVCTVGVKYYIVYMYSMPYYTYGGTANFLFLEPTALIYCISKERRCNEDLHGV